MEIFRKKNTDTRITFPIIDADGDPVSGAAGLDSEYCSYDTADHGGAAPSFSDCGHESTEIGSTGVYYLDVAAAEINKDFTHIQIKTSTSGAKTQHILICTIPRDANATQLLGTAWLTPGTAGTPDVNVKLISGDETAADNCEADYDGTGYAGGTIVKGADVTKISGDATAADNLEAACDGGSYNVGGGAIVAASVTTKTGYQLAADQAVNATKIGGTTQTGRDLGLSVLLSPGTGVGQISLSSGVVTVGTNNDKTGYALSTAGVLAIWHQALSAIETASTVGKIIKDYLDAAISTRAATGSDGDTLETLSDQLDDVPTATENADAILLRDWTAIVAAVPDRCLLQAARFLRNAWSIVSTVLHVKKENDSTDAWTADVSATEGVITGMDPIDE